MGTPTYQPLANITLGSSAASVTFSSISQAYRDLVLVVKANLAVGPGDMIIRLNGDSGSNYSIVRMSGNGSTATSQAFTASAAYTGVIARATTSVEWQAISQVMDYSATDKHKTILTRSDNASNGVEANANRWANTSAVTSIEVKEINGTSMVAGSTFALYGIAS